jgi:hypothetical protein
MRWRRLAWVVLPVVALAAAYLGLRAYQMRAQDDDDAVYYTDEATWNAYRDKVKVPAALFPGAAQVRLYVNAQFIWISRKGALREGTFPQGGAILSAGEVAQLRHAVFYAPAPKRETLCCIPRHAFVFTDAHGKFLGDLEVCYECGCARIAPLSAPNARLRTVMWDETRIAKIIAAHHLPIRFPARKS